ncbi:hypothetical protein KJ951_00810 [Patescibacteria group bacterium]|nr:hypothetical protein [Patescibacteria group bacterium]MBU1702920.1 hypothetical protein [Patescibacteria group bacterium]MBU1953490.1 hypothetical protein [Patescibacteria group bacterium]
MFRHFLQNIVDISVSELPRVIYGWVLRFFLRFGFVVGWTVVIAVAVTRFSINTLPLIFMVNAFFTIVGMLFFSVLIDRLSMKQVLTLNIFFAVTTLFVAFLEYDNDIAFTVLALIASGMFLTQISIILSSYLEEFFSPLEAERVIPHIESAETIGGISGGIFLAYFASSVVGSHMLIIWIICLLIFLLLLFSFMPSVPLYLEKIDNQSKRMIRKKFSWNAIVKSTEQIKKIPFLQILLTVLFFHWIIAHFIEFLYTKAVEESVVSANESAHEASLTYGLGSLSIFFYGSALFVQLFISSRIIKSVGTFAGFIINSIVTLLSAVSMLFGYGYITAILARNNFEISSIIQKNAYESSYYAFKYGTLRSIREFLEGVIYPLATIVGTSLILGIQTFFLENHFMYVVPFMLLFLTIIMSIFSFQLQSKYTDLTLKNLYSSIPIARHHAIEIISQKGHQKSFESLRKLYKMNDNFEIRKKIIMSMGYLGNISAVNFILKIIVDRDERYYRVALEAIEKLGGSLKRTRISEDVCKDASSAICLFIDNHRDDGLRGLAIRALSRYNPHSLVKYLNSNDTVLQAEAAVALWEMNLYRKKIKRMIQLIIEGKDIDSYRKMARMIGGIRLGGMLKKMTGFGNSSNPELRLLAYFSFLKSNKFRYLPDLINLLLYGNEVTFRKGIELVHCLNIGQKRKILHSLMPIGQLENLPDTEEGRRMFRRMREIYDVCEAYDENSYINFLSPRFQEVQSVT